MWAGYGGWVRGSKSFPGDVVDTPPRGGYGPLSMAKTVRNWTASYFAVDHEAPSNTIMGIRIPSYIYPHYKKYSWSYVGISIWVYMVSLRWGHTDVRSFHARCSIGSSEPFENQRNPAMR